MRRKLIAIALLLGATPAAAQYTPSKTIKLTNKASGEVVGTVTVSGDSAYLYDKEGNHIQTMVRNADGTKTVYDPSGKVITPPGN